jgi:hypothetical protein
LRVLLSQSQTGQVKIPLSEILHPFIGKNINTFSTCSGPNCMNSGLSVNEGDAFEQKHLGNKFQFLDTVYKRYRFVEQNESLRIGDLLVYEDSDGQVKHVSSALNENIVFTKNGLSKFNPYVFQTRSQNEALYFRDGKFKLMIFRIPEAGRSSVSPFGYFSFEGQPIFYKDQVSIGFANKCIELFN